MRLVVVVSTLVLGACVEPGLVPCGDNVCPRSSMCVENRCATSDQVAACNGMPDGADCAVGDASGTCDLGVCVLSRCGNLVVDPGEECDDGNTVGGDGCSADCKKVEACSDGFVDVGEGCDDGNANPSDGCDLCKASLWDATAMLGGSAIAHVNLFEPNGIALDRDGNLFIADRIAQRVRRVTPGGITTTVAGNGAPGYSGDGGPAAGASLNYPAGVAVDGLGTLYIADSLNFRLRRVDPFTGIITTIAGTGTANYTGDGGPAINATMRAPNSVAVDGLGNVLFSDSNNQVIRRIDLNGTITTVAGDGVPGFSGDNGPATSAHLQYPAQIAIGANGDLLLADLSNHRVRRVTPAGTITTIAGSGVVGSGGDGGLATSAQLDAPNGLAVDAAGNLTITDSSANRVRYVNAAGTISTIAGTGAIGFGGDGGPASAALFNRPNAAAVDASGRIYLSDLYNRCIRRITAGSIDTFAGSAEQSFGGDGGGATAAAVVSTLGIAFDTAGNTYLTDGASSVVRKIDTRGVISTVAGNGVAGFSGDGGPATMASLTYPYGVAVDAAGVLYIADSGNNRIRRVVNGTITTYAGTGTAGLSGDGGPALSAQLSTPDGLHIDAAGNLLFADMGNHRIRKITPGGTISTVAGSIGGFAGDGGPATSARLATPQDVVTDAAGNLYIADSQNRRVRMVAASTGTITTIAGTGANGDGGDGGPATSATFGWTQSITVLGSDIIVADNGNNRVRRISGGNISAFAGSTSGFSGDGGPAVMAQMSFVQDVAVDAAGAVYIGDGSAGGHVRKVVQGTITSIAGQVDPANVGPFTSALLSTPAAIAIAPDFTLFAGGPSGRVQAVRPGSNWLEVVAGRYPQAVATGALARFRDQTFGSVGGIAYDAANKRIYITETSKNRVLAITALDAAKPETWTVAPLANSVGLAGFVEGPAAAARFRSPTGLYFVAASSTLYVADTNNHVIRAIDLSSGIAGATVRTIAGVPATRGYFGDGAAATSALLFAPEALTVCPNGDLFIADTGNRRIRRITPATSTISSILGDGVAASSGEGSPAVSFPVHDPRGLACDSRGNLFISSATAVRLVPANNAGVIDGAGQVLTIFGAQPRDRFPANVTACLTGIAVVDDRTTRVIDACTGLMIELVRRTP